MDWLEQITKFAEENDFEVQHIEDLDYARYTTIRFYNPKNQKGYRHVMLTSELNSLSSSSRAINEMCDRAAKALL